MKQEVENEQGGDVVMKEIKQEEKDDENKEQVDEDECSTRDVYNDLIQFYNLVSIFDTSATFSI